MQPRLIQISIDGDPATKGRPRFTGSGRVYTPKRTKAAEEEIAWEIRAAYPGIEPADSARFLVDMQFKQSTYHRRDIDNMIKVVFDACNGLIWKDDAQVDAVTATIERGAGTGSSVITVTQIAPADDRPTYTCKVCGAVSRMYSSWPARDTCSAECAAILKSGRSLKEPVPCAECAKPFKRQNRQQRYCSNTCRHKWLNRLHRSRARVNQCADCGQPKPNTGAKRCRACWLAWKRAGEPA